MQFTCPKCGSHRIEEVSLNSGVIGVLEKILKLGRLTAKKFNTQDYKGRLSLRCKDCGHAFFIILN